MNNIGIGRFESLFGLGLFLVCGIVAAETPEDETIEIQGYECQKYKIIAEVQDIGMYIWATKDIKIMKPKRVRKCVKEDFDPTIADWLDKIDKLSTPQEVKNFKDGVFTAKKAHLQRRYWAGVQLMKKEASPDQLDDIRLTEDVILERQACLNDLFREAQVFPKNADRNQIIHTPACDGL